MRNVGSTQNFFDIGVPTRKSRNRANEFSTDHRQFNDALHAGLFGCLNDTDFAPYLVGIAWGNETESMDAL